MSAGSGGGHVQDVRRDPGGRLASSARAGARRSGAARRPRRRPGGRTHRSSISAWVPTTSGSSPGGELGQQVGRRARASSRSAARGTSSPGMSSAASRSAARPASRSGASTPPARRPRPRQHRVQRDDGLARADLAHQQPLHRPRPRKILADRFHRSALVVVRVNGSESAASAPAAGRAARPGLGPDPAAAPRLSAGAVSWCSGIFSSNASRWRGASASHVSRGKCSAGPRGRSGCEALAGARRPV